MNAITRDFKRTLKERDGLNKELLKQKNFIKAQLNDHKDQDALDALDQLLV
jgi:hypothetical protein